MGQELPERGGAKRGHVYVIPFPAQGHINPTLAFAKYIASKGFLVSFIMTTRMIKSATISPSTSSVSIHSISDGSEDVDGPETVEGYFKRLHTFLSQNLAKLLDEHITNSPKVIIYDSVMPWILEIAHRRGMLGAPFFTQSSTVCAVYYHLKQGSLLRFPYEEDLVVSLPSLPTLETTDLPSFARFPSNQIIVDLHTDQFSNIEKADWIFFNTFHHLETEILSWMESHWPIKTVGPTFLLGRQDEQFPDDLTHTISIFEPKHDACREWLDSMQAGSVVYVSFGSIASLGKEQMEELALGLTMSNCHFLWVVRSTEVDKLPQDFTSLASKQGLLVEWCHQPEVLAHHALACFMSHCGWNSTLEALSYGVPVIAMAQWSDQITHSKMVEDVWSFGVRVRPDGNGIISREEIAKCIKEVVLGHKGVELKEKASKWKELAKEAVEEGGTSANNIEDFVSKLMCS